MIIIIIKTMKQSDQKKYNKYLIHRHSFPGVESVLNKKKKTSITRLKANLYCPKLKDKPLPLIDSHQKKKESISKEEQIFKLTLKEKGPIKAKFVIEDNDIVSDTTISEEKKPKAVIDKISIFYEIEKSTLIIQKVFKGYIYRKKYKQNIKKKIASTSKTLTLKDINNSLNSSMSVAISEVSIDEKEIEDFNDESFSDLNEI